MRHRSAEHPYDAGCGCKLTVAEIGMQHRLGLSCVLVRPDKIMKTLRETVRT